eukprot:c19549_g1_i3 orf=448-741(+)
MEHELNDALQENLVLEMFRPLFTKRSIDTKCSDLPRDGDNNCNGQQRDRWADCLFSNFEQDLVFLYCQLWRVKSSKGLTVHSQCKLNKCLRKLMVLS